MPQGLHVTTLNKATKAYTVELPQTDLHLNRYCFRLDSNQDDKFSLSVDLAFNSQKESSIKSDWVEMDAQLLVSFFTTESSQAVNDCKFPAIGDTVKQTTQGSNDWQEITYNKNKEVTLQCQKKLTNDQYVCQNIPLFSGELHEYDTYAGIEIGIYSHQFNEPLEIEDQSTLVIMTRDKEHMYYLSSIKLAFFLGTLVCAIMFKKQLNIFHYEDLGIIQKWIMLLLIALLFYDDPLYPLRQYIPAQVYNGWQAICDSTFISLILFFWILTIHSIAYSEQILDLDERRFFRPKVALCITLWLFMLIKEFYLRMQRKQDPSYYVNYNQDASILYLRIAGCVLLSLYLFYLVIVSYKALYAIRQMKQNYKKVVWLTLITMMISLVSLFFQGEFTSRVHTPLYLAQYSLMNLYLWAVAYLYSPNVDYSPHQVSNTIKGLSSIFSRSADKSLKQSEHDQIMGQFYEQELPEYSLEEDDIYDNENQSTNHSTKASTSKQKNNNRKTGGDSAKKQQQEMLWQNIVSQAEADDDEDSSDEDSHANTDYI